MTVRWTLPWAGTLLLACAVTTEPPAERVGVAQSALQWAQQAALSAAAALSGDHFGYAVAIDGDLAVIGAPDVDGDVFGEGAVYPFERLGGDWLPLPALDPPASSLQGLGAAVAVDGQRIVVGIERDAGGVGRAYVYDRGGDGFVHTATLAPNPAAANLHFGKAVAVDGDTIAVGADGGGPGGAVFLFALNGSWSQTQQIAPVLDAGDDFGAALSLSGDTLLVGAPREDEGATDSGAAYVFVRSAGSWMQQAKLTGGGAANARFGLSVSLEDNRALIGAPGVSAEGGAVTGAGYVFVRSAGVWPQQERLSVLDPSDGAALGHAVALAGDLALLGAPFADGGNGVGAAYVFVRRSGDWLQDAKLTGAPASALARFGVAVALSGRTLLVGDDFGVGSQPGSGAAYVFGVSGSGAPCTGPESCATGFCVDGVCCDSACGDGAADCQACSLAAGSSADGRCEPIARGTPCRAAGGVCDAPEVCNGDDPLCPDDAAEPDGIACDDFDDCTLGDTCRAGVCTSGEDVCVEPPITVGGRACGCRLAGDPAPSLPWWLLALPWLRRRRRRG